MGKYKVRSKITFSLSDLSIDFIRKTAKKYKMDMSELVENALITYRVFLSSSAGCSEKESISN